MLLRKGHGVERDSVHADGVRALDVGAPEVERHSTAGTGRARDDLEGPGDLRRVVRHHRGGRRGDGGGYHLHWEGGEGGGRHGGGGLAVRGGGGSERGGGEVHAGVQGGRGVGHDDRGRHRRHAAGADRLLGSRDVHVQRLHLLLLLLLQGLHGRHVVDDLQTAGQVPEDTVLDVLVDLPHGAHITHHLLGALVETSAVLADNVGVLRHDPGSLLTLQCTQVFDRQLQDVRLLQLGKLGALHTRKDGHVNVMRVVGELYTQMTGKKNHNYVHQVTKN